MEIDVSDYGNKFGEPVITGFTRSFAQRIPNGERREYLKPIMFSGGVGHLHAFLSSVRCTRGSRRRTCWW